MHSVFETSYRKVVGKTKSSEKLVIKPTNFIVEYNNFLKNLKIEIPPGIFWEAFDDFKNLTPTDHEIAKELITKYAPLFGGQKGKPVGIFLTRFDGTKKALKGSDPGTFMLRISVSQCCLVACINRGSDIKNVLLKKTDSLIGINDLPSVDDVKEFIGAASCFERIRTTSDVRPIDQFDIPVITSIIRPREDRSENSLFESLNLLHYLPDSLRLQIFLLSQDQEIVKSIFRNTKPRFDFAPQNCKTFYIKTEEKPHRIGLSVTINEGGHTKTTYFFRLEKGGKLNHENFKPLDSIKELKEHFLRLKCIYIDAAISNEIIDDNKRSNNNNSQPQPKCP